MLFIGIVHASYQIDVHAFKDSFLGTAYIKAKHVGNAWEATQNMPWNVQNQTFSFYTTTSPWYGSPYELCSGRMTCEGKTCEDTVPWNSSGITNIYLGISSAEPIPDPEPIID